MESLHLAQAPFAHNPTRIKAIVPDGTAPCVCIAVAHPSKLYITRSGIVTHNTTVTGDSTQKATREEQGYIDGEPYTPFNEPLSDTQRKLIVDTFISRSEDKHIKRIGEVEDSSDIAAKSHAFQALAKSEGWTFHRDAGGEKYFWIENADGAILNVRISDHANVNRGYHSKESDINIAPSDGVNGYDTFESALWKMRNASIDEYGDTLIAGEPSLRFSRSPATKAAYESRIDALFDGAQASRDGVKVLDSSDVMGLLGHKGQPVVLAESKVRQGQDNHPRMTAALWKKIPEWMENPAAVFKSDTVKGRLVMIAPELVNGSPVRMIIEPDTKVGELQVHLLANAYDAEGKTPWLRWAEDGLTQYIDKKKFPAILAPSGLQLSRVEQKTQGTGKILTEKNLAGYRKEQAANQTADSRASATAQNPSSPSKVWSAITGMFDGIQDLQSRLEAGTTVVQSHDDLPAHLRQDAKDAGAQAIYDHKTKRVYMVASQIEAGTEKAVWLHEVFHKRGKELLGDAHQRLHNAAQNWAKRPEGSMERQIYDAAHARAMADGNYAEEFLPYAIEEAVNRGVQPNLKGNVTQAGYWLGRVREAFAAAIAKLTGSKPTPEALQAHDLVAAAYGAAGLEASSGKTNKAAMVAAMRGDKPAPVSTYGMSDAEHNAWQELSKMDSLFALPKTHATDVVQAMRDIDPNFKFLSTVESKFDNGSTRYNFETKDGEKFSITVRKNVEGGANYQGKYGYDGDFAKGSEGKWYTDRAGEDSKGVSDGRDDVFIDVSQLKGAGNGAKVYAAAGDFAHNTGKVFIGDPASLSNDGMQRRPIQMLASAMRWGATEHLAPHPRQMVGDESIGVPALAWKKGDDMGNLRKLVDLSLKLEQDSPHGLNISYDPSNGNFLDSEGKTLPRDGIYLAAISRFPRGEITPETLRQSGRSNARAAVLRALLRAESEGAGGSNGRPVGLLEGLSRSVRSDGELASGERNLNALFSRAKAADTQYSGYTEAQRNAAEKVFGTVTQPTLKERWNDIRQNIGVRMRQGLVDQFAPIKDLSNKAYMLARLSKGTDGAVEAAMLYGKPFLRDGVLDVNINDGGFAKVLASLDGEHDRMLQWVAALRAEKLKQEGKENLLTDSDISGLKSLADGKMQDGRERKAVYDAALKELNAFNEANLRVALESGLIDQKAYEIMRDQPYVPFYRIMDEQGVSGQRFSAGLAGQQFSKKLKGGEQQLNKDLLHNILLNWGSIYSASAKNRAALETLQAAKGMGIATQVASGTKDAVSVRNGGVQEHWAVSDPHLLDAITALSYGGNAMAKHLAPFKKLLTLGVTINPAFKIRNLIRDSIAAIAQSDLSYNPMANIVNGWKALDKNGQTYASMLAGGGMMRFGTLEDSSKARHQLEKLGVRVLDKDGFGKLKDQMHTLWSAYEEIGDKSENLNRAALYEQLRKKGIGHAEANFMARDLLDFSMSGKWETVRFLTQTVPFLNARLQGLYKLGRAAADDPRKTAAVLGAVSLVSLGLLAAYGDDDDWKKREDWDRDNYWWFKIGGTAFRVPKPFEVGAIGTLAERTAELMMSKEMTASRFGQRISSMVFQTFAMDPTPQAIKPFVDVYSNKDSFSGKAIEGAGDQNLLPADRYSERTSEAARLLGKAGLPNPVNLAKGEYSQLSPKQIDFLLKGYFGWLATVGTTATDYASRPLTDRGDRPTMQLKDTFLAGNFVESLPTGSSRYVTAMYDQAKDIDQTWASYQAALKSGDTEKANSIMQSDGDKLRKHAMVSAASARMSQLGQLAKRVEASKTMDSDTKRQKLDEISALRDKIARGVASAGAV